jgi:hypothetical protein
LHGLNRFHENQFGLQPFFAKKAFIAGNDVRHVQDASRNVGDAPGGEFGGFFRRPDGLTRRRSHQQNEKEQYSDSHFSAHACLTPCELIVF